MNKEVEKVLRSFTRLNTATGHQVYSFKCDDNYTMEMAVKDYFNVREHIINQQEEIESLDKTNKLIEQDINEVNDKLDKIEEEMKKLNKDYKDNGSIDVIHIININRILKEVQNE